MAVNVRPMDPVKGDPMINERDYWQDPDYVAPDPEKEKLLNVALNKIDGEWDYEKLKDLFDEINEEDIKFTGFTAEEIDSLFDTNISVPNDDQEEPDEAEKNVPEEDDKEDKPKEFNIYLSFPTKELAEKWL
mgnify:CR=1 FL=1